MIVGPFIVEGVFAWYDLWIGAYFDHKSGWLYVLPLPTVGCRIRYVPVKRHRPDAVCECRHTYAQHSRWGRRRCKIKGHGFVCYCGGFRETIPF